VKVEARAITGKARQPASIVMMSSVMPSAKNSCSGSPLKLANGKTAMARRSSKPGGLATATGSVTPRSSASSAVAPPIR
jgi:hypothetical protein